MAAAPAPPPQEQLVDYEVDSEDAAWEAANAAAPAPAAGPGPDARRQAAAAAATPPPEPPPSSAARRPGHPQPAALARRAPRAPAPGGEEPARSADGWVLFVTGLHPEAQEDDVLDLFSGGGGGGGGGPPAAKALSLGLRREDGAGAGYALVEYADEAGARWAVDSLGGSEFLGRTLRVDFAFKKGPRGARR